MHDDADQFWSKMQKLNKDQRRVEFIKLVSDENENQINSSNNRNSCVLLQSSALANNEFVYKKFANDKDKVGISLKDLILDSTSE